MTRQIGSYILTEQVVVSDVGTVWRGYDRGGGGPVQVKVGEPRVSELRGSKVTSDELGHTGIVPIRDCFLAEDGAPVLVTDPPQGRTLADAYIGYDGDYRQIAHLIRECAMTLAAYHNAGMTHGDISERTVWIDESDLPVFAEFGMGIRMDAMPSSEPVAKGGEGREREFKLNVRGDLFALGTVMYRLLSGEKATERPLAELSNPFSEFDDIPPIDRVAPEAPTELRAICAQLLATDPIHRYLDAEVLVRDLESYLHGKRSKPVVKFVFAIVGALLVGLFGIWGVTSGGPARILDVTMNVQRAGDGGRVEKLAMAELAARTGDALYLNVILSKPSDIAVYYRDSAGTVRAWEIAKPTRSNQRVFSLPLDASSNGWKVPSPGGVGVFVVVTGDDISELDSLVELEFMSIGQPPKTYVPIIWRGKNLAGYATQNLESEVIKTPNKSRWKSFAPYADQLIKNIQSSADDVAVGWVYVIGA
ncbi:MAG: hypothetical protein DHS20C16_12560 [Phycisphaerae bacterium]|nr:MAG: hypothetical protein DHS20C16_12560 [Phycisphaerae bacterium]